MLKQAVEAHASDIFIMAGMPLAYKAKGKFINVNEDRLSPLQSEALVQEIYGLGHRSMEWAEESGDDDFSITVPQLSRFRVSIYKQRGSLAFPIIKPCKFQKALCLWRKKPRGWCW